MITTVTRIPASNAYRRTNKATERYLEDRVWQKTMDERLWQRALRRLEGPVQTDPDKKPTRRAASFAAVLRAVQAKLGRHVDIYV